MQPLRMARFRLVRQRAGLGDPLRDLAQLDVEPLRRGAKDVEGLVGGDVPLGHEDALGLPDDVA